MQLTRGTKLGPYEIVDLLGSGGMGEVYRANDPRIGREVALKILPESFAEDKDRLRRFAQEAQAAGILNHPAILSIFDIGSDHFPPFLVSELLEGETLRERLQRGALPRRKTIELALQITSGLAAAHEKGIVHRDLKPENIFITRDGRAKILDFGLAKLIHPEASASEQSKLQTVEPQSQPGTMLGTIGYMAPEQVRGLASDHRSDIFAFGAILYEMLTGKRTFHGNTNADTLSAILQKDPDLSESDLPLPLVRIVQHCLEKNPEERLQSMRDVHIYLEALSGLSGTGVTSPALPASTARFTRMLPWGAAIFTALVAALFAFGYFQRIPKPDKPIVLSIPAGGSGFNTPLIVDAGISSFFGLGVAVSPDGSRLVYGASDGNNRYILWDRQFDNPTPRPLEGTENSNYPFWSPDSRFVGFFADGKLKTIEIETGIVRQLCDATAGRGGTWNRDGHILFSPDKYGALFLVPATDGRPQQITATLKEGYSTRWPSFLPDGEHFLYTEFGENQSFIKIGSIGSKEEKIIAREFSNAAFTPPDIVLFVQNGRLVAQQLDLKKLELKGEAVLVSKQNVVQNHARAFASFALSQSGILAYQPDTVPASKLFVVDRSGKQIVEVGEKAYFTSPRFSPDDKKILVVRRETHIEPGDLWLLDLAKESMSRLTHHDALIGGAAWSFDGKKIYFGINELFQKSASGTTPEEVTFSSGFSKITSDLSNDGKYQLFLIDNRNTLQDIWVLPLYGDKKPFPFVSTPIQENDAKFSPDGNWVVYGSFESGQSEIYVRPFPDADAGKWQISTSGGNLPVWRGDGKEIFFHNAGKIYAVDVTFEPSFESGTPKPLFDVAPPTLADDSFYDVTNDGQRFVLTTHPRFRHISSITVVLNWMSGTRFKH